MASYAPSPRDIIHVSALLSCTRLPPELIDIILEHAEYWARITTSLERESPLVNRSLTQHVQLITVRPICSGATDTGHYIGAADSRTDFYKEPFLSSPPNNSGLLASALSGISRLFRGLTVAIGLVTGTNTDNNETSMEAGTRAQYYLSLPWTSIPEPRGRHPVRRITWKIRSHDQGWGGEPGDIYQNSWTGFRGNVRRFKSRSDAQESAFNQRDSRVHNELPENSSEERWDSTGGSDGDREFEDLTDQEEAIAHEGEQDEVWPRGGDFFENVQIQVNRRANNEWRDHHVVWDHRDDIEEDDPRAMEELKKQGRGLRTGNGSQVKALCKGDVIELWSYAFFPGWANYVQEAQVIVEFAL